MKKKVYIAGRVTGENKLECAAKFAKTQKEIEALGFEAVNPLKVVGTWDVKWETAMKKCIKALVDCDTVFLLPCANRSTGAKIEVELAAWLGIPVTTNMAHLTHNT